jgi:hypothetical protein
MVLKCYFSTVQNKSAPISKSTGALSKKFESAIPLEYLLQTYLCSPREDLQLFYPKQNNLSSPKTN